MFFVVSACGLMVVDQQPLEPMLQWTPIMLFMCYLNTFTILSCEQHLYFSLNISASLYDLFGCGVDHQPWERMLQWTPSWSSCAIWTSSPASLSEQSSCLCLNISASLSDLSGCGEDNQPAEQMLQWTPSWSSCAIWISSLVSLSEHLCQPIWSLSDVVKTTNSWNNASVTPTMIFRCYLNVFSSLSFEQHSYLCLNISVSPSDLFGCSEDIAFQIDSQEGMDNKLSRILVNQSQYIPKEVLV